MHETFRLRQGSGKKAFSFTTCVLLLFVVSINPVGYDDNILAELIVEIWGNNDTKRGD